MRQCFSAPLRRVRSWPLLGLALAGVLLAIPAAAQTAISASETVQIAPEALSSQVTHLLEEGLLLEQQHRWGEALSHYQEATHQYPGDRQLSGRLDQARLHYSIERRYVDRSFVDAVRQLESSQAEDLYAKLLQMIDTHYVQPPSWKQLVRRGVVSLDVALTKTDFLRQNGIRTSKERLQQLRREIYQPLQTEAIASRQHAVAAVKQVAQLAAKQIGLSPTATLLEFTAAAGDGLDTYSAFLSGDELSDTFSQIEGNFVGLGVVLDSSPAEAGAVAGLRILEVIPGSPADRAHIQPGDVITEIDHQSLTNMTLDKAAAMLTGEEGTYVHLRVMPAPSLLTEEQLQWPANRTSWEANLCREQVETPSLEEVKLISPHDGVAYVRVPVFQKNTRNDLEKALWELLDKGMRSLVIDLRGNPGGMLTSSVELADMFVPKGRIVSTRGRSTEENFDFRAHQAGTWRVPLVVLIDDQSASASEIFAAAIRDNRRGTVIGQRSYGKGTVQGIFQLGYAGTGVRLTTSKFYSPSGQAISKVGVQPDIAVRLAKAGAAETRMVGYRGSIADDPTLAQAVEVARHQKPLR